MTPTSNLPLASASSKHRNTTPQENGSVRDGFGTGLLEAGRRNKAVVAVNADLAESVRLTEFQKAFPDRFFEVGVAEQNLVGVACGLALGGKIAFAASYAAFSPGNSWGVIRTSVCYSQLNVKIIGGHAGLSADRDGATHQALEDIALMRVLPNMTVVVPADELQAYQATLALAEQVGPAYLRLSKTVAPAITNEFDHTGTFQLGKAQVVRSGGDITLVACGTMVTVALTTAAALAEDGISAEVINLHTIKPLDASTILASLERTHALVTLEEHQLAGGMGSAVAEMLVQKKTRVAFQMIGVQDSFGESGSNDALLEKYGLTSQYSRAVAKKVLVEKKLYEVRSI